MINICNVTKIIEGTKIHKYLVIFILGKHIAIVSSYAHEDSALVFVFLLQSCSPNTSGYLHNTNGGQLS